jgi:hypothetical protein
MTLHPALEERETPRDAFDAEYEVYAIRSDFRNLVRLIGFD